MMTWQEIILLFTAVVNGVAACLAWMVKLSWSKEYRDATDRIIQAKDEAIASKEAEIAVFNAHIEQLERLNPKTIAEWSRAQHEMAEEYIKTVKHQLNEAHETIKRLEARGEETKKESWRARKAEEELRNSVLILEKGLKKQEPPDFATFVNSANLSLQLSGALMETVSESSSSKGMLNITTKKETS